MTGWTGVKCETSTGTCNSSLFWIYYDHELFIFVIIATNYCLNQPCKNGGQCSNTATSYQCTCPSGYAGSNCEAVKAPSTRIFNLKIYGDNNFYL